jgi:replicative DNA helicase
VSTPELVPYEMLAKEILRRCFAEEDPTMLRQWLSEQVARMGGDTQDDAVLLWEDSFDFYDKLMEKREQDATAPMADRKVLDWPWHTWNSLIDPLEPGLLAVISAPDGTGKCLGKGTKIVMYNGTIKAVEDIVVGDLLMGPDSTPRRVLTLGRGRDQMYWIHQKGGISYRTNSEHILALYVRKEIWQNRRKVGARKEYCEIAVKDALHQWSPIYMNRYVQGFKVPVEWSEQAVMLDPYFLGLWLGDGNKRNGMILTADQEVVDWLTGYAGELGCGIIVRPDKEGKPCLRVLISNGRGGNQDKHSNSPRVRLREMGLIENKHIPQDYISNSAAVRLSLLAGLVDSDGYYDRKAKAYEITQKDESLCRQIKFMADSLGFSTTLRAKRATIKGRGVDTEVWRLTIRGDIERIPVRVLRKQAEPRLINKDWRVWSIEIVPDGEDEYYGFTLDGDHRFLLEDMTVTHNTILAESIAEHWARHKNHVVFVHYELNRALMMDRRTSRHTSITRRDLKSGSLTPEQKQYVADMRPRLMAWDGGITYLHTPGWTMERTVERLRALKADGLCDVVVLDYLEKNAASRRQLQMYGGNTNQREADNVEQLKNFSEETETPSLMLTQFSKAGKNTSFENIDRTDIRGAGEKTEKANIVVLMHREKSGDGYSNKVNVLVDKNTVGKTGTFQQMMEPEFFRLGDIVQVPLNASDYRWNGADR